MKFHLNLIPLWFHEVSSVFLYIKSILRNMICSSRIPFCIVVIVFLIFFFCCWRLGGCARKGAVFVLLHAVAQVWIRVAAFDRDHDLLLFSNVYKSSTLSSAARECHSLNWERSRSATPFYQKERCGSGPHIYEVSAIMSGPLLSLFFLMFGN